MLENIHNLHYLHSEIKKHEINSFSGVGLKNGTYTTYTQRCKGVGSVCRGVFAKRPNSSLREPQCRLCMGVGFLRVQRVLSNEMWRVSRAIFSSLNVGCLRHYEC